MFAQPSNRFNLERGAIIGRENKLKSCICIKALQLGMKHKPEMKNTDTGLGKEPRHRGIPLEGLTLEIAFGPGEKVPHETGIQFGNFS
jgi:hypothetical protein